MNHGTNASSPSTTWRMGQGSAQTFYPATAGVLRVTSGRAWATLSPSPLKAQPRWSAETDPGDIFVAPGSALRLQARQKVVIEAWPADPAQPTWLVWEADAMSASAVQWQRTVQQPLRELGQGTSQVIRALSRLIMGIARYGVFLIAGRSKVQPAP